MDIRITLNRVASWEKLAESAVIMIEGVYWEKVV